jgi:hypothetical protein
MEIEPAERGEIVYGVMVGKHITHRLGSVARDCFGKDEGRL